MSFSSKLAKFAHKARLGKIARSLGIHRSAVKRSRAKLPREVLGLQRLGPPRKRKAPLSKGTGRRPPKKWFDQCVAAVAAQGKAGKPHKSRALLAEVGKTRRSGRLTPRMAADRDRVVSMLSASARPRHRAAKRTKRAGTSERSKFIKAQMAAGRTRKQAVAAWNLSHRKNPKRPKKAKAAPKRAKRTTKRKASKKAPKRKASKKAPKRKASKKEPKRKAPKKAPKRKASKKAPKRKMHKG